MGRGLLIGVDAGSTTCKAVLFDLEGGELVAVSAWKNWIYLQLWLRSHAPQWLGTTHVYRFILGRLTGSDPFGTLPSDDLDHQIEWQIAKIREMLESLIARGTRDGFEVIVLNYPDRPALIHGGDYTKSTYHGLPTKILGSRGNEHMKHLREAIRGTGAHYVDGMRIFLDRGYAADEIDALYLEDDPHMNERGNALLAEIMSEKGDDSVLLVEVDRVEKNRLCGGETHLTPGRSTGPWPNRNRSKCRERRWSW